MGFTKRWFAIQLLIVIVIFCLGEIWVRWQGHIPGDLRPNWSNFQPVDSLVVYHDFYVDSSGILVADGTNKPNINSDGFRAAEWKDIDSAKHKILLIGDSFTWGLSATSPDSCFADLLQTQTSETIINTGIPIADPAQYDAIAQKYIPKLKPEKVLVFFYLGNDIMSAERPIVPLRPFYYFTNARALMAYDDTTYLATAQEAYDYYSHKKFFLINPDSFIEKIISKSALLSRIYSLKYRWKEKTKAENSIQDMRITQRHLYSIVKVCREHHCALQIFLIPEVKEADEPVSFFEKRYVGFFQDSILAKYTYVPAGNSSHYYVPYPDGHFNNAGHAFFAKKILEQLRK